MHIELTLVRHGHTEWNGLGRYQGQAPITQSDRGLALARCLAEALAVRPAYAAIYSSDLPRCTQTADLIAEALEMPVLVDARFREIDYGHWQGLTRNELAALNPDCFQAYRERQIDTRIPGGESQRLLQERVKAGLTDVLAAHPGERVLLVTHGGPIREVLCLFGLWQGGPPVGNASCTVLTVDETGQMAQIVQWADVTHLPPDLRPDSCGTTFIT